MKQVKSLGHFFNPHVTLENRLGLAGANYELTSSLPQILKYFRSDPSSSWAAIEEHEGVLQSTLLDYLNKRNDVTIIGDKDADTKKRVCTVSFVVRDRSSQEVVEQVDAVTNGEMGIRWGAFYSNRLVHDFLGLEKDGVVRVSMVHYNTVEEVRKLINVLEKVLGKQVFI